MKLDQSLHRFPRLNAAFGVAAYAAAVVALVTGIVAAAHRETAVESFVPRPYVTAPAATWTIATFTGEYVDGVPVYKLPPVTVVAGHRFEVAAAK